MEKKVLALMWKEAQREKLRYFKAVSDIEIRHLHQGTEEASFIWLDELLLGIEVRKGRLKRMYYDEDIRRGFSTAQEAKALAKDGRRRAVVA